MGDSAITDAIKMCRRERNFHALIHLWRGGYILSDDEADLIEQGLHINGGRPAKESASESTERRAAFVMEYRARKKDEGRGRAAKERAIAATRLLYPDISEDTAHRAIDGKIPEVRRALKIRKNDINGRSDR